MRIKIYFFIKYFSEFNKIKKTINKFNCKLKIKEF